MSPSIGRAELCQVNSSQTELDRVWDWSISWKRLHYCGCTWRCYIWVTLISTRSPCPEWMLDTWKAFWLLEPSRDLSPFFFTCLLRPIAVKVLVESPLPWPENPDISHDLSMELVWRRVSNNPTRRRNWHVYSMRNEILFNFIQLNSKNWHC